MTLPCPAFEKRLRQRVRAELNASPDLRRQVRETRKPKVASKDSSRLLFTLLAVMFFAAFAGRIRNVEFSLAIISLWTAGVAFSKAQHWFQTFYGSEDLVALNLLPLSDEQIFRFQSRKFAWKFGWTFLELTLVYLAAGLLQESWNALIYFAPLLALVQTGLIFSISLHFVVFLHALPLGAISNLFRGGALLLLVFATQAQSFIPYLIQFSYWFFPTGWINYALMQSAFREDAITLLLLLPAGAIIYAGRYSWERLRAFYSLDGFELALQPGLFGAADQIASRGATEIQDSIGEGGFRRALDWPGSGWLERWISKSLHGRDRLVLEFLVAEDPGWTRSLKGAFLIFGFGAGVVYLFGEYSGFIVFFPGYLLAAAALPMFGGEWRGLQQLPSSGVFLPLHALYPVGFKEMTRVMLRVNVFRAVAAAPLLLAFGLLAAWKLGHPLLLGWKVTCKILGLFLVLQPLFVLFPLSRSARYSSARWLHLLVNIPLLAMLILLSAGFFMVSVPLHTALLLAGILLLAVLMHALYRRAFNRGKLDLLHTRTTASG